MRLDVAVRQVPRRKLSASGGMAAARMEEFGSDTGVKTRPESDLCCAIEGGLWEGIRDFFLDRGEILGILSFWIFCRLEKANF